MFIVHNGNADVVFDVNLIDEGDVLARGSIGRPNGVLNTVFYTTVFDALGVFVTIMSDVIFDGVKCNACNVICLLLRTILEIVSFSVRSYRVNVFVLRRNVHIVFDLFNLLDVSDTVSTLFGTKCDVPWCFLLRHHR